MTLTSDPKQATELAKRLVLEAIQEGPRPIVKAFFDEPTFTVSYVIHCSSTKVAAIVDSVLDFDAPSGRISHRSAEALAVYIEAEGLCVEWLLETHAHADHLSAAPWLQERLGGKLAIGREIIRVQETFGKIFNAGTDFERDRSQFDHLFDDGDTFTIGDVKVIALHVPGHTPADMAYVAGDAVFTGDTLFMPDYGSARADFPGGDARQLFRSIRRLMTLPDDTRVFLCHDYKAPGRDSFAWETTILVERASNVHARDGVTEDDFIKMRIERDATLAMPKLLLPSVQVNMCGGRLPTAEENGTRYLKLPLDRF